MTIIFRDPGDSEVVVNLLVLVTFIHRINRSARLGPKANTLEMNPVKAKEMAVPWENGTPSNLKPR